MGLAIAALAQVAEQGVEVAGAVVAVHLQREALRLPGSDALGRAGTRCGPQRLVEVPEEGGGAVVAVVAHGPGAGVRAVHRADRFDQVQVADLIAHVEEDVGDVEGRRAGRVVADGEREGLEIHDLVGERRPSHSAGVESLLAWLKPKDESAPAGAAKATERNPRARTAAPCLHHCCFRMRPSCAGRSGREAAVVSAKSQRKVYSIVPEGM